MFRSAIVFCFALFIVASCVAQEWNRQDENGLKQGPWKKMYENGRVRYEGQFKDNKPYGLFKYYYENGKLMATNNHIADGRVANHAYHKNGKIKAKGIFMHQAKDSLWQYFNDQEVLVLEETYHLDTLNGAQRSYYDNGQLAEETHYSMGVKHGAWNKFFEGGEPWLEAGYDNGNLHGKFVMYADKNKMDLSGKYHEGIRTGTWMFFNTNGTIKEQKVYRHGSLQKTIPYNGEFTEYYEDQIPKSVYNYKNGKKQGEFKEYYEMGEWVRKEQQPSKPGEETEMVEELVGTQLKVSGWYNNDQLNGKVTYYNQDGSVEKVEVYENGELVSTIDWEGK